MNTYKQKPKWDKTKYHKPEEFVGRIVRTLENNMSCKVGIIDTVYKCDNQRPDYHIGTYGLQLRSGWYINSNHIEVLD